MLIHHTIRRVVVMAAALSLSSTALAAGKAACPEGQVQAAGRCVAACPKDGAFTDPNGCECPAGYGKLLGGDGTGRCSRLACPTNAPFPSGKDCECPPKHRKVAGKAGQSSCRLDGAQPAR